MAHTIPMRFFRATVESLMKRGFDLERALRGAGLDWRLYAEDRARMTPEQVTSVVRALWIQADDELLGLGPRPVPRGTLRLAGLTSIHTRDLRAALARLLELVAVGTGIRFTMETDAAGLVTISSDEPAGVRVDPLVTFSFVGGLHRYAGWLIGTPITLRSIEFPFDAEFLAEDYTVIFGVRPRFAMPRIAMSFDAALLTKPVVRNEADLKPFLRDAPGVLFYAQNQPATTAARVRTILERNPDGPWLTADDLGRRLSISAPHLRRLLRAEGTSQRRIQEEILRDRAVEALVHGDEPIADLAARLGYSEASAFRRAFHRWTGSAPIDYRASRSGNLDE
ncbi:putative HTH-type transcriptional regulator [Nocardia cerradoensis]|uniref:Putative HTH-type transcriptional regulator n=1 Tax=Nocardia cerradoensis TaxID=85688 RepID=A0A231GX71_9NOCA|nr:AraC family transcriptional regulator [Nocardia cerradoensis]OXR41199.1 putative HTH-type transcriptional regulator [Nocardia cerradoensis]